ncbi:unnamed protein product [Auanema sp. JU1783]|nr:unnamed protein product [Auanema sp. JU1783]
MAAVRSKYKIEDETAMWRFIMRILHEGRGTSIKGNVIWAEFAGYYNSPDGIVRSISSLNSHFRKKMLPSLAEAKLPLEDIVYIHNKIPLTIFNGNLFKSRCVAADCPELVKKLKKRNYFSSKCSQDVFDSSSESEGSPVRKTVDIVKQSEKAPRLSLNESVVDVLEKFQIRRRREQNPHLGLRSSTKHELSSPSTTATPRRSLRLANIPQNTLNTDPEDVPVIISPKRIKKKSILVATPTLPELALVPGTPVTRSASLRKRKAIPLEKNTAGEVDVDIVLDSNPLSDNIGSKNKASAGNETHRSKESQHISKKTTTQTRLANTDTHSETFYDSRLLDKLLDSNLQDDCEDVLSPCEEIGQAEDPVEVLSSPSTHSFFICEMSQDFVADLLQGVDENTRKHLCLDLLLHREFLQLLSDSSSYEDFSKKLTLFGNRFRDLVHSSNYELINLTQADITTANFKKFSKPINIPETKIAWDVRLEILNELFRSLTKYPVAKTLKMRYQLINAEGNAAQLGSLQQGFYDYFIEAIRKEFALNQL